MSLVINHIGLSGGKDSTALWGWAINESGYDPATIRGSFCDTENEYQEVYDQIKILDEYGQGRGLAPIAVLHSEGFLNLAIRKQRFPSAKARFCTEVLKMEPSRNYILGFLWLEGCEVLAHSGVRRDESTERSLLEEYGFNAYLGCQVRRPLLSWTVDDVWAAHRRYGLPVNPLYFKGRKRVGCKLCCMSRKNDVRVTARQHPEVIDQYRAWEKIVAEHQPHAGVATFFASKTVPPQFRSVTYTARDGEVHRVATIDDVVRWSETLRGGKEIGFQFMYEEDDAYEPCKAGYCE